MQNIKSLRDIDMVLIDTKYNGLEDGNSIIKFTEDFIHLMSDLEIAEFTNMVGDMFVRDKISFSQWIKFLATANRL